MAESEQTPITGSGATQEQQLQAAQEIKNDPQVTEGADGAEPGPYDDEEAWTFRKLQAEIKERNEGRDEDDRISGQGTREELAQRLTEDDAKGASAPDEPEDEDEPAISGVQNIEVAEVELSGTHADVLQGLSDARKAAQLAAVAQAEQA